MKASQMPTLGLDTMADFRTRSEQQDDVDNALWRDQEHESEARQALREMKPKIEDYKAEVKLLQEQMAELKAENAALTEALKTQMQGVEEIKGFLIERMDALATDMDQVHKKIRGIAEDDMRLVKQLSDDQSHRLAKLADMVKGG